MMDISTEEKEILRQGEEIQEIKPDFEGRYPLEKRGDFKKSYQYGTYKEVELVLYTKGALLINAVTGKTEWFNTENTDKAFEKAKKISARYRNLNNLLR